MKRYIIGILGTLLLFLITSSGHTRELRLELKDHLKHSSLNTEELFIQFMVDEDLSNFVLEEEGYIDDIPFDTEMVFYDIMSEESLNQFALTDEYYILLCIQ